MSRRAQPLIGAAQLAPEAEATLAASLALQRPLRVRATLTKQRPSSIRESWQRTVARHISQDAHYASCHVMLQPI
eukprot:scaffold155737_cov27-Tisochrysis_lutea.AAC.4